MFTTLGDFQQFKPDVYKLPWWDREDTGWALGGVIFEFSFFVITIIM